LRVCGIDTWAGYRRNDVGIVRDPDPTAGIHRLLGVTHASIVEALAENVIGCVADQRREFWGRLVALCCRRPDVIDAGHALVAKF